MIKKIKLLFQKIISKFKINMNIVDTLTPQLVQKLIFFEYKKMTNTKGGIDFDETGFSVFSQTDEDGKLLYIFSQIGFTNKKLVDIAFATPYGSNSTNLICNWGFSALLIDGNDLSKSKEFFQSNKSTCLFPPHLKTTWITAENINEICTSNGFVGEIDLLSLDLDGVDYWILKNLDVVTPRVIVLEYQDILGPTRSWTIPYSESFNRFDIHPDFSGASLSAFVKLASTKGYKLIGINELGYNAFFLREDLGNSSFPKIEISDCFKHPKVQEGMKTRYPLVSHLPWIEV